MKKLLFISVFWFLILNSHFSIAQPAQGLSTKDYKPIIQTIKINQSDTLPFPINRHFSYQQGLPRGDIQSLIQTDDGFTWLLMRKHGLVRFDGYHFTSFIPIPGDTTSFPSSDVHFMTKSKNDGLWIISSKGLIWFDLKTYKSKLIKHLPKLEAASHAIPWRCTEDRWNQLWLWSLNKLYLYHPETESFEDFTNKPAINGISGSAVNISNKGFFGSPVTGVTMDSIGSFWLLCDDGILKIDARTKKIFFYPAPKNFDRLGANILPEPNGENVWISDLDDLLRFNQKQNTWIVLKQINAGYNDLANIKDEKLWMMSEGMMKALDINNFTIEVYIKEVTGRKVLPILVEGIYGMQWLWTSGKGFYLIPASMNRFSYKKILPNREQMLGYWKDDQHNIEWFTSIDTEGKGKLHKHDRDLNKITTYKIPVTKMSPQVLLPLPGGNLLIVCAAMGIGGKLYSFNIKTGSFRQLSKRFTNHLNLTTDSINFYSYNYNNCAVTDEKGNIWLTTFNQGLLKYDVHKNTAQLFTHNPSDIQSISSNTLAGVIYSQGFIWTGDALLSGEAVLSKVDPSSGKVQRIPFIKENLGVNPLCTDKDGNIWIGTGNGMVRFNPVTNDLFQIPNMKYYTYKAIYDSLTNAIIALAGDGLWVYHIKSKDQQRFDESNGIRQDYYDFVFNRLNVSGKGEIIFSDFYRFTTEDLSPRMIMTAVHILSLKANGKDLPNHKNIHFLDTFILKHNQNHLAIEFATLNFLPAQRFTYYYFMQGVDDDWQIGTNNNVVYTNLSPGNYRFRVTAGEHDMVQKERIINIIILPAFWQTLWFKILVLVAITAGLYAAYKYRMAHLRLQNDLEKERLEKKQREEVFQRKLTEIELSALRSQMNPHFIFNCLNSITRYAAENNAEAATEYLSKFSQLIRLVLENSRSEHVTLAAELQCLQLYMDMEAMRFKNKLKYDVNLSEEIDAEYIEIPPLLLQPYVENAIWHGLMHKEEGGCIKIDVYKNLNKEDLQVSITDNGVGRARAAELKSKSATRHKSFGIKLTSERITLINELYKTNTNVTINDLYNEDGTPAGTEVIISIPI